MGQSLLKQYNHTVWYSKTNIILLLYDVLEVLASLIRCKLNFTQKGKNIYKIPVVITQPTQSNSVGIAGFVFRKMAAFCTSVYDRKAAVTGICISLEILLMCTNWY